MAAFRRGSRTRHAEQSRQGLCEPPSRTLRALVDSLSTPFLKRFRVRAGVDRAGQGRNGLNTGYASSICLERGERYRYTSGSSPLKCGSCGGPRRMTLFPRCRRFVCSSRSPNRKKQAGALLTEQRCFLNKSELQSRKAAGLPRTRSFDQANTTEEKLR